MALTVNSIARSNPLVVSIFADVHVVRVFASVAIQTPGVLCKCNSMRARHSQAFGLPFERGPNIARTPEGRLALKLGLQVGI